MALSSYSGLQGKPITTTVQQQVWNYKKCWVHETSRKTPRRSFTQGIKRWRELVYSASAARDWGGNDFYHDDLNKFYISLLVGYVPSEQAFVSDKNLYRIKT